MCDPLSQEVTVSELHHYILKYILDHQHSPSRSQLASQFKVSEEVMMRSLQLLADYHGVVLHPNGDIWVIHPFSLAPSLFTVSSASNKKWWCPCAWCSLGAAGLIDEDTTITTRLGGIGDLVSLRVINKQLLDQEYCIHFPIKMKDAWDNVIYTCSVMLLFGNEDEVDLWCLERNIKKGSVQPVSKIFDFAKEWYANHLNPDWKKWTVIEATELFRRHDLHGDIWDLPCSKIERF